MADLKISQLPVATTPLAGTELVPIVQSATTKQTTAAALLTGTVPSGTANGVLYLNGSKVVTSGSGLTFDGTSFTVGNKITLLSDSPFLTGANLTSGANPLAIGGSTGNSVVAFFVNNAEQMRLNSTGLGIGTNNPVSKLSIIEANRANSTNIGNINVYTSTAQAADVGATISLGGLFSASGYAPFGSIRGGKENSTDNNYAGYLAFQTIPSGGNLTERMRLDSSGNLGIGTSSPSAKLHVVGSTYRQNSVTGSFGFTINTTSATTTLVTLFGGSSFAIQTGASGTNQLLLDASGNLGIGTSSPGHKLTVHGGINVTSSATLPAALGSMLFSYEAPINRIYMGDGTGYSFAFSKRVSSTTTDLVTLTDAGNLGIGTTSPASAIHASRASGVAVYLQLAQTGVASWQIGMSASSNGLAFLQSGSEKIRIKETGQLRYIPLAADPAGAENGDVYYNSTTNKLRVYAGGAWVDLH
jgi:hypothetical protein